MRSIHISESSTHGASLHPPHTCLPSHTIQLQDQGKQERAEHFFVLAHVYHQLETTLEKNPELYSIDSRYSTGIDTEWQIDSYQWGT